MAETVGSGPRCVALFGPYVSDKTSLLEAMLVAADRVVIASGTGTAVVTARAEPTTRNERGVAPHRHGPILISNDPQPEPENDDG